MLGLGTFYCFSYYLLHMLHLVEEKRKKMVCTANVLDINENYAYVMTLEHTHRY